MAPGHSCEWLCKSDALFLGHRSSCLKLSVVVISEIQASQGQTLRSGGSGGSQPGQGLPEVVEEASLAVC